MDLLQKMQKKFFPIQYLIIKKEKPKEFNIQECNPIEACIMFPDAAFCQGESSGSWSRDGNSNYCDEYPEDNYCQDHDSMCEYYPYSVDCAEWKSFCNMYPNSPECDTTYEPWCVRYPEDPDCDR